MSATESTTKEIASIGPDFSEVEWKVAPSDVQQRVTDYGSLEAVQKLLQGSAIEVPPGTYLNRLYRWLHKNGYSLRRRKYHDSLVVWVEKRPEEPESTDK